MTNRELNLKAISGELIHCTHQTTLLTYRQQQKQKSEMGS